MNLSQATLFLNQVVTRGWPPLRGGSQLVTGGENKHDLHWPQTLAKGDTAVIVAVTGNQTAGKMDQTKQTQP